ncbi:MAG: ATP-dependent helicase [Acidobacteriota bacterium]
MVELDDSQKRFCSIDSGPVRLLAPAGSGKTHALLWRCKTLAERSDKTKPRFMVFTFTRAARDELRDRVRTNPQFKETAPFISVTTLNSWGFRLVKSVTTSARLVVTSKERFFCIQNVLQPVWQEFPSIKALLEDSRKKNKAGQDLLSLIDFMKSMGFRHDLLTTPVVFAVHLKTLFDCGMQTQVEAFLRRLTDLDLLQPGDNVVEQLFQQFIPFWRQATTHLFRSALLSLEDQKYWARIELEKQLEEGRFTTGAARCHHILVDEFQDINPLDLALLKAIAGVNKAELTIVGDDDQAIYEWRGATPEFILEPRKYLGGTYQTCILATNYRSPRNIIELSQKLIVHNKRRVAKDVKAAHLTDARVEVRRFPAISQAIRSTVDLVRSLLNDRTCHNVALIGRKRSQIIPYQIVFAGQNIPFYAAEDLHVLLSDAFSELKEILAIRARSTMVGPFGSDAVQDLLKLCDKIKRYPISKKDRDGLSRHLYQAQPSNLKEAVSALFRYLGPLKGANDGGRMSASFAEAVSHLIAAKSVAESIQAVSVHFDGLQKDYGKGLEDIFYTDPPFLYLAEFAEQYGTDYVRFYADIEKAIATLARVSPDDEEEDRNQKAEWKLPLHLMTALRAKGKEFDAVIVLDANDGIWPSKLAKSDNDREQERRLFYVAMTRARRYLYFIVNDSIIGEASVPTPYLAEMGLLH